MAQQVRDDFVQIAMNRSDIGAGHVETGDVIAGDAVTAIAGALENEVEGDLVCHARSKLASSMQNLLPFPDSFLAYLAAA